MTRGRTVALGILALLAVAAAPLLGTWVVGVAAVLVVLAAVTTGRGAAGVVSAFALGVLGGLAGAASAIAALLSHAADPIYAGRAWIGGVALFLGLVAAAGGLLVPTRPRLAALLLVLGSLLGFIAINRYDINTLYFVALPACWLAAVVALVARPAGG
jgi:hypothetical protein